MQAKSLEHLSLAGKVAVVTGGTQGLGETIAHLFADRGAAGLVICGRNEKNGAQGQRRRSRRRALQGRSTSRPTSPRSRTPGA